MTCRVYRVYVLSTERFDCRVLPRVVLISVSIEAAMDAARALVTIFGRPTWVEEHARPANIVTIDLRERMRIKGTLPQ